MSVQQSEPSVTDLLSERIKSEPKSPVLKIEDLSLAHGREPVIRIPNLQVHNGEVLAIIGRSGCGKTTLLSCLSGHHLATSGEYFLAGERQGARLRKTFVSRTLQGAPLLHWLTVIGNLRLAARIRKVDCADYESILSTFAAEALAYRYPSTLSGGERCRASLCQALLGNPQLLLLDEPFTGLDSIVKDFVAGNLFRLARASGAAILFVTHDLHDAVEFSDRVVIIGGSRPATVVGEFLADTPDVIRLIRALLER